MLIINADDFGKDAATNAAILDCFLHGWISTASIMANMPGFREACALAREHELQGRIGIHLVLTEGIPLSDIIRRCPRFCNERGDFHLKRTSRLVRLTAVEKRAVIEEVKAQIEHCRAEKLRLIHADSHHHVHEEWALLREIISVLAEAGIPALRGANNLYHSPSLIKRCYRALANRYIKSRCEPRTFQFGSAMDLLHAAPTGKDLSAEVMLHPVLDSQGRAVDRETGEPVEHLVAKLVMISRS